MPVFEGSGWQIGIAEAGACFSSDRWPSELPGGPEIDFNIRLRLEINKCSLLITG